MIDVERIARGQGIWLRLAGWGLGAFILIAPAVAMQFSDEVQWGPEDFLFAAIMIGLTGGVIELTVRLSGNIAYRAATALVMLTGFLLIWITAAVGFIGSENHPANAMYAGVIAIAIVGGALVRFRARAMALVMTATAVAQAATGVVALFLGHFVLLPTAVFFALWYSAGTLYRKAAETRAPGKSVDTGHSV